MIKKWFRHTCIKSFRKRKINGFSPEKHGLNAFDNSWKEGHALLISVFENADGYVWCIDSRRRYIAFNSAVSKAIKEVFGVDIKHGDKAYRVLEAMDPSRIEEWKNLYKFGFQGKPQQVVHEFSIYGQKMFFDLRLNPIQKGDKIIGLTCFAKDITQQILYVEQLQMAIAKARIETKEKERDEIGKELHDNVNQMLVSVMMYLSHALQYPVKAKDLLHKTIGIINTAIEELRQLSSSLVVASPSEKSLKENIYTLINDIEFIQGRFIFHNLATFDESFLSNRLKTCVFRIIQEQMTNIIKYAEASEVSISIVQQDKVLRLSIDDNGKGFDVKAKRYGIGISNIIDRAEANDGTVTIDSAPGKGCRLTVRFRIPG